MKKYTTAKACGKTLNKILANCNVLGRDKLVKILAKNHLSNFRIS
jgi:hypothetical protein